MPLQPVRQRPISIPALREEGDKQTFPLTTTTVQFLSPPSARRATTTQTGVSTRVLISIPALREEGDYVDNLSVDAKRISIPALREEGDLALLGVVFHAPAFLSPPSARRATRSAHCFPLALIISIPALREEGDLPRLPEKPYMEISIPALREEGDGIIYTHSPFTLDFYPRPPRGGRRF